MGRKRNAPERSLSPDACILGAVLLVTVPLPWIAGAFAAAAFHELCHVLAVYALGERIRSFRIGGGGALLELGPVSNGKELLCAAAGPMGSLLLVLLYRRFPRLAACGLIQGCFNLLPVYPMDGGRILQCILRCFLGDRLGERVGESVQWTVIVLLLAAGIYVSFRYSLGIIPTVAMITVIFRILSRKIPCKDGLQRVQ